MPERRAGALGVVVLATLAAATGAAAAAPLATPAPAAAGMERITFQDARRGILRDDRGGYRSHEWLRIADEESADLIADLERAMATG